VPQSKGEIAIIGAGLGGLTAALALMRDGFRVRVYEQAPALGEVGAGITVSSGAGAALASLGLGPALLAASLPVPDIAFVHYRTGALLAGSFDKNAPPDHGFAKARHIHRADLHALLLSAVRGRDEDAVMTGARLVAVEDGADGVAIQFADGGRATADALIAADGVRSTVRKLCFGDDSPPFAGQIAFRCLIPHAEAAPFMGAGNAVVSVGAARIFNRYLIRGGALVNVIGIARTDQWQQEGWSTPATIAEFAAAFDGFHQDVLGLIGQAPEKNLIKWGLFARSRAEHWARGRVLLIGDAAHPMLPFLGLGAATAIEDGIVLARALAQGPDFATAFNVFQCTRAGRVEAVRTESIRQGEIIQATDPDRGGLAQAPSQSASLFDYDPGTIPLETSSHYR
jgi:salicylate hydroxylase